MGYTAKIDNIEWDEVDVDHNFIVAHYPKTIEEARSIIQHYFSSPEIYDEYEERERTTEMVALYGIELKNDRNLLASSLELDWV